MSLKNKAIQGFSWSIIEGVFGQVILFLIGILLARILSPKDFGIIGLTTVVISVSTTIVSSGFSEALIRKENVTEKEFSTVFFINLATAIVIYFLLFFSSSYISEYFEQPILEKIIKVVGFTIIITALSLVHRSILIRKLNFKLQAIISIVATMISGVLAVFMAYNKCGIWSLVFLSLIRQSLTCILLWLFNYWKPRLIFSKKSFVEFYSYSYKLLLADLINTLYSNIYYGIIGKVYSADALGYYTRADGFQKPFSANIGLGIRKISFTILAKVQESPEELKAKFSRFIKVNVLISSLVMFFIMGAAKSIIINLVGEKWFTSIYYTQLLCIPGLLYGLQVLNLNLLVLKGYTNLSLKLEIIKKIILLPLVFISSYFQIEILLYCFVLFSFVEFFINSYYTMRMINYSILEQITDIIPFFIIGALGGAIVYVIGFVISDLKILLLFQVLVYSIYYLLVFRFVNIPEYRIVTEIYYNIKNRMF